MKIKIVVLAVSLLGTTASFAGDVSFKCSSKQMGKFNLSFNGKTAQTDFDSLIEGRNAVPFEIKMDEEYDDEEGNLLYAYQSKEGRAEFYLAKNLPQGGANMKNGRPGGYVYIKLNFRVGLRLPQQYVAACYLNNR